MVDNEFYRIKIKDKIKNKERIFYSDKNPIVEYNCILINVFVIFMFREEYFPCERFDIVQIDKTNLEGE